MFEQSSPWITPAMVLALFIWLRSDIRDLRRDLTARLHGLDGRLRAVKTGLAELRGRLDSMDRQFAFLREYITGGNVRGQRPTEAGADE